MSSTDTPTLTEQRDTVRAELTALDPPVAYPDPAEVLLALKADRGRARERLLDADDIAHLLASVRGALEQLPPLPSRLRSLVAARESGGTVANAYAKHGTAYSDVVTARVEMLDGALVVRCTASRTYACASSPPCIDGSQVDDAERAVLRSLGWTGRGGRWRPST